MGTRLAPTLNLTPNHRHVLRRLREDPTLVGSDLSNEMGIRATSVTRLMQQLVEAGYLTPVCRPLTPKGKLALTSPQLTDEELDRAIAEDLALIRAAAATTAPLLREIWSSPGDAIYDDL